MARASAKDGRVGVRSVPDDDGDRRGELAHDAVLRAPVLPRQHRELGRLVERDEPRMPLIPVRWSYRGMRLDLPSATDVAPDTVGMLSLRPAPWLAVGIALPTRVLASADAGGRHCLWLAFDSMPDALSDAMERHLFRLHRRQVAAQRGATP